MNALMNRYLLPAVCLVLLVIAAGTSTADDQQQSGANATTQAPAEPLRPIDTERLDAVGDTVGKGIEKIGDNAAGILGQWITRKSPLGISWMKLFFCLAIILAVLVFERLIRWALQHKIDAIPHYEGVISWLRLILQAIVKPLSLFIFVYGLYAAMSPLFGHFESASGDNLVLSIAKRGADIGGTVALFWFFYRMVSLVDARLLRWAEGSDSSIDTLLVPLIGKSLRIFIVIIGGMMVLQNLTGIQIGPLLASLGIGGLAVALAAKDSIANFFGTLTILFDKPFQAGDRIVINDFDGTVETVGFRSTRIRLLNGHLVSIPNEKVVNSAVENIGLRPNIRWLTDIGLTYDTPAVKIQRAVEILRSILENHEGQDPEFPPRVYFNGFNDWSLNVTVVVWYHPPEYWDFQDWLQQTCLEVIRQFDAEGIDFAFPSQTLYLANEDRRQLKLQLLQGTTSSSEA